MPIAPGTRFGHYIVRSLLGAGGMGEVYLAEDELLGRTVALKVLSAGASCSQQPVQRFLQEAKAASALNHPNILTIHEIGRSDDTCYIVTEFIEGVTLRQHMKSTQMKVSDVLDILIQAADALARAHHAGILHRDIKPENIMVRADGIVKILDFGLAKLTERQAHVHDTEAPTRGLVSTDPGIVVGTALYMSPEQVRSLDVDPRTDVWSLGVVLYEMAAGRVPFEGATDIDVLAAIIDREPPPLARFAPGVPHQLERIVAKALAKDREGRYQTIKDLLIDLKNLRRELEFEAELDRTIAPELRVALGSATRGSRHALAATLHAPAVATADAVARPTAAAGYDFNKTKRRKRVAALVAVLALAATVAGLFVYLRRAPALTEKDTILLADFANATSDPVFDGTLKQALAVQLGQSPFLDIYSEERVRQSLRFMGRSPDERVTRDVGREICQRQGLKAMLAGSIASLGNHYVVTLEAVNAQTGDAIAREQAEAESKEQVLRALGEAAKKLREKLGESLQSIQKFDAPVEQATTPSLEALQAFSLGVEQQLKGREAVPFLKRATEIDPDFALAYGRLSSMYWNVGQYDLAAEASRKAYDLRDRVSERERLYISATYYDNVTGELEKYLETLELWGRTYPRDAVPRNNSALKYNELGQYEKAAEEAREAVRLNPNAASCYSILAAALVGLNRLDEAREVIAQALARKLENTIMHRTLYRIAFLQGDAAAMQREIEWAAGKPDGYSFQNSQAETAACAGQLQKAKEFSDRAFESAQHRGLKEVAAQFAAGAAARDALFGDCGRVREKAETALAVSHNQLTLVLSAQALAACGESGQTQAIVSELVRRFPKGTLLNKVSLPLIQARLELHRNNPAQAIRLLETTRPYEGYALFQIAHLRGQAYLDQQKGADAAAEFQKVIDRRHWQPTSPLYQLAHLGLARATALSGDTARARQAYEDFFALWKDADRDIPDLQAARQEYERL